MTRALALALTALTGFSGLVYEVAWEKYLATLLGSHSEATAAVLGIFLGGLSLGYSVFGSVTRRVVAAGRARRLLLLYGTVEAGIGAYVLLFPTLFAWAVAASGFLPQGVTGLGFALDVCLSALLIGPPAVLMGGTIPILTQALSRDAADSTRFHAFVYAFNTAGAFAGALAAGFLLIPSYGLVGVMTAMGIVNLSAGAIFGVLGLRGFRTPPEAAEVSGPALRVQSFTTYAAAVLLIGFAMMTLQTVLIRMGALSFGASQFTFSMVVAVFVLCIALGSFAVSALPSIPRAALVVSQWLLAALMGLLYLLLPLGPYAAHVLRTLFRDTDAAFHPFYASAFLALLLLIGPAVILSGAALPLTFHLLRREVSDLGAIAGRLYSWNTLGSLLGALLGGYALLFWLDLHAVYRVAMVAIVVAAVLLSTRLTGRARSIGVAAGVPATLAILLLAPWDPSYLAFGPYRERLPKPSSYSGPAAYFEQYDKVIIKYYSDGPVSSVAVLEATTPGGEMHRSIVNNGKSDGNTLTDYPTMALAAIVPGLLAERNESGFVIGYGTGVTAGELASLPGMREVVVAEISAGVIEAAPFFDFANLETSKNPKVEMIRSDAYRALMRSEARYDVIASEPSNPWVAGVEMLFSQEFLTAARDRLAPGGVYAQWYHQYSSDRRSVELVLRTYRSVFDRVAVWYGLGPDLLLLGFADDRTIDLEQLEARAALPEFGAALERSGISSFAGLLAHEILPVGVLQQLRLPGRIHTLVHPILGYRAARAFFRGQGAVLPPTGIGEAGRVGARNSLLGQYKSKFEPSREVLFEAVCPPRGRSEQCIALLASWWRQDPGSTEVEAFVERAAERTRMFGGRVTLDLVKAVSPLFRDSTGAADRSPIKLEVAERAIAHYERYFSHATPFSPRALLELVQRCEDPEGGQGLCQRARAYARSLW